MSRRGRGRSHSTPPLVSAEAGSPESSLSGAPPQARDALQVPTRDLVLRLGATPLPSLLTWAAEAGIRDGVPHPWDLPEHIPLTLVPCPSLAELLIFSDFTHFLFWAPRGPRGRPGAGVGALHRCPSASVMPAGPGPGQSSVPELGPWDACRGPAASLLRCSRSRGLTRSVFPLPSPSPPCPPHLVRPRHPPHHLQWDPTVGGRGSRDTQQRTVPRTHGAVGCFVGFE